MLNFTILKNFNNIKKLVPNFFDKEKYVLHYKKLQLYFKVSIEIKKILHITEFNQSQWLKPYAEFNILKRIEAEKNRDKNAT